MSSLRERTVFVCEHEPAKTPFKITVKGEEMLIDPEAGYCPACAQEYLERFSRTCARCNKLIVPGTAVIDVQVGDNWSLAHSSDGDPMHVAGTWGEGKIDPWWAKKRRR